MNFELMEVTLLSPTQKARCEIYKNLLPDAIAEVRRVVRRPVSDAVGFQVQQIIKREAKNA